MAQTDDYLNTAKTFARGAKRIATERVKAFIDRYTDFTGGNMRLAEYHLNRKNYDDAAMRFRMVLWKDSRNANAWAGLCESYLLLGELDKAKEALAQARKLQPNSARADYARQMVEVYENAMREPPRTE